MVALCNVIGTLKITLQIREIAALQIKNALDARTDRGQEVKNQRYLSIGNDFKEQIKKPLLVALHDVNVPRVRAGRQRKRLLR